MENMLDFMKVDKKHISLESYDLIKMSPFPSEGDSLKLF